MVVRRLSFCYSVYRRIYSFRSFLRTGRYFRCNVIAFFYRLLSVSVDRAFCGSYRTVLDRDRDRD